MDTLKGKQIMVWAFMGSARMHEAPRDNTDRRGICSPGVSAYTLICLSRMDIVGAFARDYAGRGSRENPG